MSLIVSKPRLDMPGMELLRHWLQKWRGRWLSGVLNEDFAGGAGCGYNVYAFAGKCECHGCVGGAPGGDSGSRSGVYAYPLAGLKP